MARRPRVMWAPKRARGASGGRERGGGGGKGGEACKNMSKCGRMRPHGRLLAVLGLRGRRPGQAPKQLWCSSRASIPRQREQSGLGLSTSWSGGCGPSEFDVSIAPSAPLLHQPRFKRKGSGETSHARHIESSSHQSSVRSRATSQPACT